MFVSTNETTDLRSNVLIFLLGKCNIEWKHAIKLTMQSALRLVLAIILICRSEWNDSSHAYSMVFASDLKCVWDSKMTVKSVCTRLSSIRLWWGIQVSFRASGELHHLTRKGNFDEAKTEVSFSLWRIIWICGGCFSLWSSIWRNKKRVLISATMLTVYGKTREEEQSVERPWLLVPALKRNNYPLTEITLLASNELFWLFYKEL